MGQFFQLYLIYLNLSQGEINIIGYLFVFKIFWGELFSEYICFELLINIENIINLLFHMLIPIEVRIDLIL